MEKIKDYINYGIIGIISFLALVFLPMLGSSAAVNLILPSTVAGWLVWIVTKAIVAVINFLIFHCFILQGKENAKKTDLFKKAEDLLKIANPKVKKTIISPQEWTTKQYKEKGVTIFITSFLSVFALTQAILAYDWITMLTYLFTIIMGIIFGILQQQKTFEKWSSGYLEYAEWLCEENGIETSTIKNNTLMEEKKNDNK